jgi:hypothetical protein
VNGQTWADFYRPAAVPRQTAAQDAAARRQQAALKRRRETPRSGPADDLWRAFYRVADVASTSGATLKDLLLGAFVGTDHSQPPIGPRSAREVGELVSAALPFMGLPKKAAKAVQSAATAAKKGIRAYHGSPYDFDKFSLSQIGTGEGAQAYGHGLYFAESPGTAKSYRAALTDEVLKVGDDAVMTATSADPWDTLSLRDRAGRLIETSARSGQSDPFESVIRSLKRGPSSKEADALITEVEELKRVGARMESAGHTYEVNINASLDDLLDLDAPLSQQSPEVRGRLNEFLLQQNPEARQAVGLVDEFARISQNNPVLGSKYYDQMRRRAEIQSEIDALANQFGQRGDSFKDAVARDASGAAQRQFRALVDEFNALPNIDPPITGKAVVTRLEGQLGPSGGSSALRDAGIPGSKYYDQMSRGAGEGTRNYVMFDDTLIDILRKFGLVLAAGAGAEGVRQGRR